MKKMFIILGLVTSLFSVEQLEKSKAGVDGLSISLRGLLSQEMLAIEKGMHTIFSNIISGNYEDIASKATEIQDSFIMLRSLTPEQRKELQENLPKAFIKLDRGFHELAGELANAAEFEDKTLVEENFSKMTQACVQCHSTYATSRFSTFQE